MTSLQVARARQSPLDVVADGIGRTATCAPRSVRGGNDRRRRASATRRRRPPGATDFGEYFLYFSFFLVVSALLLAALFFKLGVEQRAREVGLLRAVGMDAAGVRRLFLTEALLRRDRGQRPRPGRRRRLCVGWSSRVCARGGSARSAQRRSRCT